MIHFKVKYYNTLVNYKTINLVCAYKEYIENRTLDNADEIYKFHRLFPFNGMEQYNI